MNKISLNGSYKLYITDGKNFDFDGVNFNGLGEPIDATVPGNVELDLMRANLLPNLYFADNIKKAEYLESKDFVYVKDFEFDFNDNCHRELVFDGVDTIAEYYLNGVKIGESENAFVEYRFSVDDVLRNGSNRLVVHIFSSVNHAKKYEHTPLNIGIYDGCYESLNIRKPASSFGWDILPRAVSAGIFRDVYIREYSAVEITNVYIATNRLVDNLAILTVSVNARIADEFLGKLTLKISGKCKDSEFNKICPFTFTSKTVFPYVENPVLWYPCGYGAPDLYDVTVELVSDGKVMAQKSIKFGIRSVDVRYTEEIGENGDFRIFVNDKLIKVKGVNHTPIDVYHSKDKEKYADIIGGIKNMNCNFVRVWGGGVYESDEFYSLCDENGIMVWHDFMLACHMYPQTKDFLDKISFECKNVVERLRNHPSIIAWCGSNETDWMYTCIGLNPNDDKITRVVMKDVLSAVDPFRPFFPTTPYFSNDFIKKQGGVFYVDLDEITAKRRPLSEEHYWWHRNDFLKFTDQNHKFIMEIGYGGCNSLDELNKYLPVGWTFKDDKFWGCHSYPTEDSRTTGLDYLLDGVENNNEELVSASRAYQAEAYKYIVERSRIRPYFNGICLWNYGDGFPIFSSAFVGYDGDKRPSYFTVKDSYEPVQCIMKYENGKVEVYIVNDTSFEGKVGLKISCVYGAKEKEIEIKANEILLADTISCGENQLITSELNVCGKSVGNYLYTYGGKIDYRRYKELLRSKAERH